MCLTTYTPQLLCCEWPVHHVSCGRTLDGWDTASGVFSATFAGKDLPASIPHPPQCSLLGQLTLKQNGENSNQFKTACNQVPRKTHTIHIFYIYTHFTPFLRDNFFPLSLKKLNDLLYCCHHASWAWGKVIKQNQTLLHQICLTTPVFLYLSAWNAPNFGLAKNVIQYMLWLREIWIIMTTWTQDK